MSSDPGEGSATTGNEGSATGHTPLSEVPAWRVIQSAAALLVLALFLYSLRGLFNPFLLFWVLVVVLLPFRGMPGYVLLVALAAVLTGLWVLETTGFLLAPFVLALVVAYILDPAVDVLQERGVARSLGIALLALPLLGGLATLVLWGVPALSRELAELVRRAPEIVGALAAWLEAFQGRFVTVDLPLVDEAAFLERLRALESQDLVDFLERRRTAIGRRIWEGVLGLGRGIGSVFTVAGYVVVTPVLIFFLLRDWNRLVDGMKDLLPEESRGRVVRFASEYDELLSGYLRGQITVALTVGALTALGLWVLGFPYAFLLGAIVAVFNIVPYLGLVLSLIPAVVIALVSGTVAVSLLKVAVVYGVAQSLEGAVISPRIVGESVGLHPVWVLLALMVGGFFFGFVGLLIAVPVAAGVKLALLRGLRVYRESSLYRGAKES